mmetsp:Transcript_39709/g.127242  ORF Transcript_39709/g.127242 Transcript_39709/m.127242 type:complete len:239 (-) Transcript_39709:253-969(-)
MQGGGPTRDVGLPDCGVGGSARFCFCRRGPYASEEAANGAGHRQGVFVANVPVLAAAGEAGSGERLLAAGLPADAAATDVDAAVRGSPRNRLAGSTGDGRRSSSAGGVWPRRRQLPGSRPRPRGSSAAERCTRAVGGSGSAPQGGRRQSCHRVRRLDLVVDQRDRRPSDYVPDLSLLGPGDQHEDSGGPLQPLRLGDHQFRSDRRFVIWQRGLWDGCNPVLRLFGLLLGRWRHDGAHG